MVAKQSLAFILAITEVNCQLAMKNIYGQKYDSTLHFRKALAEALIKNTYLQEEEEESPRRSPRNVVMRDHGVFHVPPFKKFLGSDLVNAETRNAQRCCIVCKRKCRTCCICTPGIYRCIDCIFDHIPGASTPV